MDIHAPPAPRRLHPAWIALLAGFVVLVVAFLPVLWAMWKTPPGPAAPGGSGPGAPWAIERLPDGATRVFALRLPGATLADVRATWGDNLQIALMATRGAAPVLEGSVETVVVGGVGGRLLFTAAAAPQDLQRWRERSPKEEPVSAETRRIVLRGEDRADAWRAPLVGIGFIPTAQLDATMLRQRFGAPSEVLGAGQPIEHWLYPAQGLAIVLDTQGRELLQYVAPADFERRLRAPLLSPSAPASSPASGLPG